MTPAWKDAVLAALDQRGHNRAWLARELGVTRSLVTKLFAVEKDGSMVQTSSALVPRICELLQLQPPMIDRPISDTDARLLELLRDAPEDLKVHVVGMLSASLKRR